MDLYSLSTYQYDLPQELIAQQPLESRDGSRLMVVERSTGLIYERRFSELADLLEKGDSLIFNNTKVIPSRLYGKRENGGKTEIFLLEQTNDGFWKALAKPARKLKKGSEITFSEGFSSRVLEVLQDGIVHLEFEDPGHFEAHLQTFGQIPLPHYIRRHPDLNDKERYQTVYASDPGAVAAPTAGLHFTKTLIETLTHKGVIQNYVTLHVGPGTFKPVSTSDIRAHKMHGERYSISEGTAASLNRRSQTHKQICVGTTCCRTLEASTNEKGIIIPGTGTTDIFIYPGYKFKYVQSLLTNFHVPGSTLLMLVCSFAGYDLIMEAYHKAVKERFRFFSYGDAMLIL